MQDDISKQLANIKVEILDNDEQKAQTTRQLLGQDRQLEGDGVDHFEDITYYDQEDDAELPYYDLYNDQDLQETMAAKDILASIQSVQKTN